MKGQKQYEAFKAGKPLSFKGAILAQCYVCSGENEGGEDCLGISCPLYQYMPYRKGRIKKQLSPERHARAVEDLKKGRETMLRQKGASQTDAGASKTG